jgi:hypothetical protein
MTLRNANPAAGDDGVGQVNIPWQNSTAREAKLDRSKSLTRQPRRVNFLAPSAAPDCAHHCCQ